MERNNKLTIDAENAQERIEKIISALTFINEKISGSLDQYQDQRQYENRLELESALLLYNRYLVDGRINLLDQEDIGELDLIESNSKFSIAIAKDWSLDDFFEVFKSVNQLYGLAYFDGNIRKIPTVDPKIQRFVPNNNYDKGNLHHYLKYDERLMVNKIHYNSPGEIEFISLVIEHFPSIIKGILFFFGVIKFIPNFLERLPQVYQQWVRSTVESRELKRIDARRKIIHDILEWKLRALARHEDLDGKDQEEVDTILIELSEKIRPFVSNNSTDPIELTGKTFESLAILAKLYREEKINLPGNL